MLYAQLHAKKREGNSPSQEGNHRKTPRRGNGNGASQGISTGSSGLPGSRVRYKVIATTLLVWEQSSLTPALFSFSHQNLRISPPLGSAAHPSRRSSSISLILLPGHVRSCPNFLTFLPSDGDLRRNKTELLRGRPYLCDMGNPPGCPN